MQKHTYLCEEAIRNGDAQKMVDNTSAIARLVHIEIFDFIIVCSCRKENIRVLK